MVELELKAFLKEWVPECAPAEIRLFRGSGIDGADAEWLMEEYARRFGVDLTPLDYSKYYTPEDRLLLRGFRTIFAPWKVPRKTFGYHHLLAVAQRGVWFDP